MRNQWRIPVHDIASLISIFLSMLHGSTYPAFCSLDQHIKLTRVGRRVASKNSSVLEAIVNAFAHVRIGHNHCFGNKSMDLFGVFGKC